MRRLANQIKSYRRQFVSVAANEYRTIFGDSGVVLVMIFALLIYSTLYSLAYHPQVLRNVPIGVVDDCKTPASRNIVSLFDAGPNTYVACKPADMEQARQMLFEREIYGIVYIPENYERQLAGGQQAVVSLYADASNFLVYRQVFQEIVTGINLTGAEVEFGRLLAKGAIEPAARATTQPVIYQTHNLFNPYLGYGSFVMPAIIMVIIQQTLLIGIGMIGGTWREYGLYSKLIPEGRTRMATLPAVLAKAMVYASIYALTSLYVLSLHYRLFHYPMNGNPWTVVAIMIPYLAACIFMGIAVSTLFRYRENSLLLLLWTSIPILLLSGASLPAQAIPDWLYAFGRIFPSSSGVNAFVRIQTMGASFDEVLPEIRTLWCLAAIYCGLACIGIHVITSSLAKKRRESD